MRSSESTAMAATSLNPVSIFPASSYLIRAGSVLRSSSRSYSNTFPGLALFPFVITEYTTIAMDKTTARVTIVKTKALDLEIFTLSNLPDPLENSHHFLHRVHHDHSAL